MKISFSTGGYSTRQYSTPERWATKHWTTGHSARERWTRRRWTTGRQAEGTLEAATEILSEPPPQPARGRRRHRRPALPQRGPPRQRPRPGALGSRRVAHHQSGCQSRWPGQRPLRRPLVAVRPSDLRRRGWCQPGGRDGPHWAQERRGSPRVLPARVGVRPASGGRAALASSQRAPEIAVAVARRRPRDNQ